MTAYITPEQATDYLANTLNAQPWSIVTPTARAAALATAQTLLDALAFTGCITNRAQTTAWPRTGVVDREGRAVASHVIPPQIAAACAEWALHLLSDKSRSTATAIKRRRVADLEVEYSSALTDPLPAMVRALLTPFLVASANVAPIAHC